MVNDSDVRWYEFGRFRLDARALVLFRGSRIVPLPPSVLETLVGLVQRPGEVLLKRDLPGGAHLRRHISVLRKALPSSKPLIETIAGRGYRFAGRVRPIPTTSSNGAGRGTPGFPAAVDALDVTIGWCSLCERHVWIAAPEAAATALGTTVRAVYRDLERGRVHYRETTAGAIAVCMPSLIDSATVLHRSER